jgi:hypothetical protein
MKLYENKHSPLLPKEQFNARLRKNIFVAFLFLVFSLLIGMSGYHFLGNLCWIDSLLNASMILTGMGPVDPLTTNAAKIFASAYSVFSGVAFLTIVAVILAPIAHRFMHKFHLSEEDERESKKEK